MLVHDGLILLLVAFHATAAVIKREAKSVVEFPNVAPFGSLNIDKPHHGHHRHSGKHNRYPWTSKFADGKTTPGNLDNPERLGCNPDLPPIECEYQVGDWCSSPLLVWPDRVSISQSRANCKLQLWNCQVAARPNTGDIAGCQDFKKWCEKIDPFDESLQTTAIFMTRFPPLNPQVQNGHPWNTTLRNDERPCTKNMQQWDPEEASPPHMAATMCYNPYNMEDDRPRHVAAIAPPIVSCSNERWAYAAKKIFKLWDAQHYVTGGFVDQRLAKTRMCLKACDMQAELCMKHVFTAVFSNPDRDSVVGDIAPEHPRYNSCQNQREYCRRANGAFWKWPEDLFDQHEKPTLFMGNLHQVHGCYNFGDYHISDSWKKCIPESNKRQIVMEKGLQYYLELPPCSHFTLKAIDNPIPSKEEQDPYYGSYYIPANSNDNLTASLTLRKRTITEDGNKVNETNRTDVNTNYQPQSNIPSFNISQNPDANETNTDEMNTDDANTDDTNTENEAIELEVKNAMDEQHQRWVISPKRFVENLLQVPDLGEYNAMSKRLRYKPTALRWIHPHTHQSAWEGFPGG